MLLNNKKVKLPKKGQKLSWGFDLIPGREELSDNGKKASLNSIVMNGINENCWQRLLQDGTCKLNLAKEDIDLSEKIKGACDDSDLLFAESPFDESLFAERTFCTYQMKDGKELSYVTVYEKDRIYCEKEGEEDCEWEIPLEDETQYDKVMSFLNGLQEKDNQSFTIHNTFWQDFLSGKLNVDEFREFLHTIGQEEVSNGFKISEDGTFINEEAKKYSIYIYGPDFGANIMRTTEDLLKWQEKQMAKALEEWEKTHLSWVEQWNKDHPDLAGVKCFIVDGKWYTSEELDKLWDEEFKSDGTVFK